MSKIKKEMNTQVKPKQGVKKEKEIAISVKNIKKSFKIHSDRPQTLKERLITKRGDKVHDFFALDDISFDVYKGTTVGLIGQNGCGKSTMLKIINRTMFPNHGTVKVNGTVSSLIELGAGFHPDLSGRENIYTNAAIFGLKKEQIDARLPEVIAFSEIEDFIDNPVRTYSSGMYARLAFSVAIHVDADILLVDEILGVGDMNFQEKCAKKIYDMKKTGKTIIIVTHDMGTTDRLCDHVIWFDHGKMMGEGNPKKLQQQYVSFMAGEKEDRMQKEEDQKNLEETPSIEELKEKNRMIPLSSFTKLGDHFGNGELLLTSVELLDENGVDKRSFHQGDTATLRVAYMAQVPPETLPVNIGISVSTLYGVHIYGSNTKRNGILNLKLEKMGVIEISLSPITLLEGNYRLGIGVSNEEETETYDHYHSIVDFKVYATDFDIGIVKLPVTYKLDGKNLSVEE